MEGGLTYSWEGALHTWLLINGKGKDLKRQTSSASECVVDEAAYLPVQKTVPWVFQPTTVCSLRQRCTQIRTLKSGRLHVTIQRLLPLSK